MDKKVRVTGKRNATVIASLLAAVRKCKETVAAGRNGGVTASNVGGSMTYSCAGGATGGSESRAFAALQAQAVSGTWLKKAKAEHRALHVAITKTNKALQKVRAKAMKPHRCFSFGVNLCVALC